MQLSARGGCALPPARLWAREEGRDSNGGSSSVLDGPLWFSRGIECAEH